MKVEGGQYGHHNHSDHRRHTVAYRWRLVWPRTVVLSSEFAYIGGMLSRNSRGRPINAPAAFIHPCRPSEWTCISQNFNEHREQLGRPMEPSSSAELTDKIMCYIRIGKAPPNNGATGTAPKLTTLWWNAVPRVKFVYRV
jgi:hypothetical protein